MIPIKLIIEGIFSYQKRQIIDFKKLSDNHLFGIFGTVGSGKSSILDAITYALFGKTDRFDKKGDNSNYNIMNLKSNQLFIEFDFITGKEACEYKIVVQGKRNSKNFEEVRTITRTAYKKINDEFIPIEKNELEEIIGLSYDNFKRTIIIPQGKFQEFLQLSNSDRTRMMKELFQLEKYELYSKTKKIEDKNNEQIQNISGNLEQIGDISEKQVTEIQAREVEIINTLEKLNSKQETITNLLKELDRLKELHNNLKIHNLKKAELDIKQPNIIDLEKKVSDYEYCAIHFKSICDSIENHISKINTVEKSIKENSLKLKELNNSLEIKAVNFSKIKMEYERISHYQKEVDDIKKVSDIAALKEKINNEASRLKKGELEVEKVKKQISESEKKENNILEKLKELRESLPNIEELSKAQQWHLENNTYIKNKSEITGEIQKLTEQSKSIFTELKAMRNELDSNLHDNDIFNWPDLIRDKINFEEKKLYETNTELEKMIIHAELDNFAKNLKEGTPCPLCGSDIHPAPFNNKEVSIKVDKLKAKKITSEKSIKKLNNQLQKINNKLILLTPINDQIKSLHEKHNNLNEKQYKHKNNIVTKYKDINLVKEAISSANLCEKQIKNLEKENNTNKANLNISIKNKERFQEELSKIQKEVEAHQTSVKLLGQQLSESSANKYLSYSKHQINEELIKIETHIENIKKQYSSLQKEIEELKKQADQHEGNINANQNFLKKEQSDHLQQQQLLKQKIIDSHFDDESSIKHILSQNIDIVKVKKDISEFNKEREMVNNKISELNEQLKDKTYNQEEHISNQKSLISINEEITITNRKLGESKALLNDLRKKLDIKRELDKKLESLTLRAENIKTIKKLFYGSGFVNYVSSVYLQNLCSAANERFFKMTRQKLSLELNQDNNFMVRDFLNGGKLRSAKTLSGGQTFQAALSLALALADNVQSITLTEQNFFFLDEGFGSLDKESLDVVFSTLKDLRKENRIVGIISHVEELQQEIPLYLKIKQDEEEGSFIEESF